MTPRPASLQAACTRSTCQPSPSSAPEGALRRPRSPGPAWKGSEASTPTSWSLSLVVAVRCGQGIAIETAVMQAVYMACIAGFCQVSQAAENQKESVAQSDFWKLCLAVYAVPHKTWSQYDTCLMQTDCKPSTDMLCFRAW